MIKWYKDLKIVKKFISTFLVIAIFGTIIGGFGITSLWQLKNTDEDLYKRDTLGLQYVGNADVSFQRLNGSVITFLDSATTELKKSVALIEECTATVDTMLENLTAITDSENGKACLEAIRTSWAKYQERLPDVVASAKLSDTSAVRQMVANALLPAADKLQSAFDELSAELSARAAGSASKNSRGATSAIIILAAIVLINIILSIFFALLNAKVIGVPLMFACKLADMLSEGNIDVSEMATKGATDLNTRKDELGDLARAFDRLIRSTFGQVKETKQLAEGDLTLKVTLRSDKDALGKCLAAVVANFNRLVATIIASANRVSASSKQLATSSMTLSQGATEQASSVQQLSASLEQVSSQTNRNAKDAETASELAHNVKREADNGNALMQDMLKAMDEINVTSSNINKIIKVIDDIAFQTNILALNAAVEAARAGQHGKGFAVVAEEVRTLAGKSAQAAKETADMITGSINSVNAGTKLANETASALSAIVNEVGKAADLIGGIAIASREQNQGIEQINLGISQVSQVVQTNAATSEESAAAGEDLTAQAQRLLDALSVFKIDATISQE